jgi:hypothetical protein
MSLSCCTAGAGLVFTAWLLDLADMLDKCQLKTWSPPESEASSRECGGILALFFPFCQTMTIHPQCIHSLLCLQGRINMTWKFLADSNITVMAKCWTPSLLRERDVSLMGFVAQHRDEFTRAQVLAINQC